MATSRRTIEDAAGAALKEAVTAATPQKQTADKKDRKPQVGELVSVRIDPIDKERFREILHSNGVTLAGGIRACAYYVMQEIEAGRLRITKAGVYKR